MRADCAGEFCAAGAYAGFGACTIGEPQFWQNFGAPTRAFPQFEQNFAMSFSSSKESTSFFKRFFKTFSIDKYFRVDALRNDIVAHEIKVLLRRVNLIFSEKFVDLD